MGTCKWISCLIAMIYKNKNSKTKTKNPFTLFQRLPNGRLLKKFFQTYIPKNSFKINQIL